MKRILFSFAFFLFCLCSKAQVDSTESNDDSDSTGYYFNWKENVDERYTIEKKEAHISNDSGIQKRKEEDEFWYVRRSEEMRQNKDKVLHDKTYRDSLIKEQLLPPDEEATGYNFDISSWFRHDWVTGILWTITIGVFLIMIGYFLSSQKIGFFGRKAASLSFEESPVKDEHLSIEDYDRLIDKYEQQKNYRFAVRANYLQFLQILAEKGLIHLAPNLTNAHYLQQLYNHFLYRDFSKLTRYYEQIWYGEVALSEPVYQRIKQDFKMAKQAQKG